MLKAIGIDFIVIVVWEQDKTYAQISFEEQCRLASVVLAGGWYANNEEVGRRANHLRT